MRDTDLFQMALGLMPPWMVKDCKFNAGEKRLDVEIDFKTGGRFPCPDCAKPDCPTHDTVMKTWRHLDFFQHQAFLSARVPRVSVSPRLRLFPLDGGRLRRRRCASPVAASSRAAARPAC